MNKKDLLKEFDEHFKNTVTFDKALVRTQLEWIATHIETETRKQVIEEIRKLMWRGATKDEAHRRLDELKKKYDTKPTEGGTQ